MFDVLWYNSQIATLMAPDPERQDELPRIHVATLCVAVLSDDMCSHS